MFGSTVVAVYIRISGGLSVCCYSFGGQCYIHVAVCYGSRVPEVAMSSLFWIFWTLLLSGASLWIGQAVPVSLDLSPVIFIPGHGGSQLEISYHGNDFSHLEGCETAPPGVWERNWLDLWQFFPGGLEVSV